MNLNDVESYKVLVIGDAIYDRYRFCDTLGRGTKESIISVKYLREEMYEGGVWASAAHIKDLVTRVDIWHSHKATVNTKYLGAYSQKLFSVHEETDCHVAYDILPISEYDLV